MFCIPCGLGLRYIFAFPCLGAQWLDLACNRLRGRKDFEVTTEESWISPLCVPTPSRVMPAVLAYASPRSSSCHPLFALAGTTKAHKERMTSRGHVLIREEVWGLQERALEVLRSEVRGHGSLCVIISMSLVKVRIFASGRWSYRR